LSDILPAKESTKGSHGHSRYTRAFQLLMPSHVYINDVCLTLSVLCRLPFQVLSVPLLRGGGFKEHLALYAWASCHLDPCPESHPERTRLPGGAIPSSGSPMEVSEENNDSVMSWVESTLKQTRAGIVGVLLALNDLPGSSTYPALANVVIETVQLVSVLFAVGNVPQQVIPWSQLQSAPIATFTGYFGEPLVGYLGLGDVASVIAVAIVGSIALGFIILAVLILRAKRVAVMVKAYAMLVHLTAGALFIPLFRALISEIITGANVLMQALSVICVLVLVAVAITIVGSVFDMNPLSTQINSRSHGRIDLLYLLGKIIIIVLACTTTSGVLLSIATTAITTACAYLYTMFVPYYNAKMMHYRAALAWIMAWCGLSALVACIYNDASNGGAVFMFIGGIPIIALASYLVVSGRLTHLRTAPLQALKNPWEFGVRFRLILKENSRDGQRDAKGVSETLGTAITASSSPKSVVVDFDNNEDVNAVDMQTDVVAYRVCKHVLKVGLSRHADSSYLALLQAQFYVDIISISFVAYMCIDKALQMDPKLDQLFIIARLQRTIASRILEAEANRDVVKFNMRRDLLDLAQRSDLRVVQSMVQFWREVLSRTPDDDAMRTLSLDIRSYTKAALHSYMKGIRINDESVTALQSYSGFLLTVMSDTRNGERMLEKANEMQEAKSGNTKQSFVFRDLLFDDKAAVIIISGALKNLAEVIDCNQRACQILGYSKATIIGKNINVFMPEPFASEHDAIMLTNLQNGRSSVFGQRRVIVFLTRSGYVVDCGVFIKQFVKDQTSLSFIGVFETIATDSLLLVMDHLGAVTAISQTAAFQLGVSRDRVNGRDVRVTDVFPSYQDYKDAYMRGSALNENFQFVFEHECNGVQFTFAATFQTYSLTENRAAEVIKLNVVSRVGVNTDGSSSAAGEDNVDEEDATETDASSEASEQDADASQQGTEEGVSQTAASESKPTSPNEPSAGNDTPTENNDQGSVGDQKENEEDDDEEEVDDEDEDEDDEDDDEDDEDDDDEEDDDDDEELEQGAGVVRSHHSKNSLSAGRGGSRHETATATSTALAGDGGGALGQKKSSHEDGTATVVTGASGGSTGSTELNLAKKRNDLVHMRWLRISSMALFLFVASASIGQVIMSNSLSSSADTNEQLTILTSRLAFNLMSIAIATRDIALIAQNDPSMARLSANNQTSAAAALSHLNTLAQSVIADRQAFVTQFTSWTPDTVAALSNNIGTVILCEQGQTATCPFSLTIFDYIAQLRLLATSISGTNPATLAEDLDPTAVSYILSNTPPVVDVLNAMSSITVAQFEQYNTTLLEVHEVDLCLEIAALLFLFLYAIRPSVAGVQLRSDKTFMATFAIPPNMIQSIMRPFLERVAILQQANESAASDEHDGGKAGTATAAAAVAGDMDGVVKAANKVESDRAVMKRRARIRDQFMGSSKFKTKRTIGYGGLTAAMAVLYTAFFVYRHDSLATWYVQQMPLGKQLQYSWYTSALVRRVAFDAREMVLASASSLAGNTTTTTTTGTASAYRAEIQNDVARIDQLRKTLAFGGTVGGVALPALVETPDDFALEFGTLCGLPGVVAPDCATFANGLISNGRQAVLVGYVGLVDDFLQTSTTALSALNRTGHAQQAASFEAAMLASSDYTTLYRIDNDFLAPASNQFGAIIEQTATDVNASRQSLSSTQLAMSLVVGAYVYFFIMVPLLNRIVGEFTHVVEFTNFIPAQARSLMHAATSADNAITNATIAADASGGGDGDRLVGRVSRALAKFPLLSIGVVLGATCAIVPQFIQLSNVGRLGMLPPAPVCVCVCVP
ncbi:hypothetical protein PBRA_000878, partial [Plasmodiophora brassicae]